MDWNFWSTDKFLACDVFANELHIHIPIYIITKMNMGTLLAANSHAVAFKH